MRVVELVTDYGAWVDSIDLQGRTPHDVAIAAGKIWCAEKIMELPREGSSGGGGGTSGGGTSGGGTSGDGRVPVAASNVAHLISSDSDEEEVETGAVQQAVFSQSGECYGLF
jgi:hypothetical protein